MNENEVVMIKMTSGKAGEHCDIYCHGSYHMVFKQNGITWTLGKRDAIPEAFKFKLEQMPANTKECNQCRNDFDSAWPFIDEQCIRCYERINFVKRDEYREAVRKEFIMELKETTPTEFWKLLKM